MVCSHCRQPGHNRRTCPQLTRVPRNQAANNLQVAASVTPTRRILSRNQSSPKKRFVKCVQDTIYMRRYLLSAIKSCKDKRPYRTLKSISKNLDYMGQDHSLCVSWGYFNNGTQLQDRLIFNIKTEHLQDNKKVVYNNWKHVRKILNVRHDILTPQKIREYLKPELYHYDEYNRSFHNRVLFSIYPEDWGIKDCIIIFQHLMNMRIHCNSIYRQLHNSQNQIVDEKKSITFVNLKDTNFLIYWVIGNNLLQDLDNQTNDIKYIGFLSKNYSYRVSTIDGHRFHLVPHKLNIEPPYHPLTDKQYFIDPYCEINIHPEIKNSSRIYIDNKDELSELNRWKFNALKLDYIIRELIKLGAKDNETLDMILDLHEDIKLDNVSEFVKEISGIPSSLTNIT